MLFVVAIHAVIIIGTGTTTTESMGRFGSAWGVGGLCGGPRQQRPALAVNVECREEVDHNTVETVVATKAGRRWYNGRRSRAVVGEEGGDATVLVMAR